FKGTQYPEASGASHLQSAAKCLISPISLEYGLSSNTALLLVNVVVVVVCTSKEPSTPKPRRFMIVTPTLNSREAEEVMLSVLPLVHSIEPSPPAFQSKVFSNQQGLAGVV